tara:strand:+ start:1397 stop:2356 length:960 start_codon:yes stop_codon:yes gene_type:complete
MSLDFIKKDNITDVVNREHSDSQVRRSVEWSEKYQGEAPLKDWLQEVPFDITEENREEYWSIYKHLSPNSDADTMSAYIGEKQREINAAPTALDKLFIVQDGMGTWNEEISQHFAPQLASLNLYATEDFAHKGTVAHKKSLESTLIGKFTQTPGGLDALVPEAIHIKDILTIEQQNRMEEATVINGRMSVREIETGKPIVGMNLESDDVGIEEQLVVSDNSYATIRKIVGPQLNIAREMTVAKKRAADESLFNILDTLDVDDAGVVISNMVKYRGISTEATLAKGIETFRKNRNPHTRDRDTIRMAGKLIDNLTKRANL